MPNRFRLVLPLANQRLRDNKEDALGAFRSALGDDETRLDGLSQADLVSKQVTLTAVLQDAPHDFDLVRLQVDTGRDQRRHSRAGPPLLPQRRHEPRSWSVPERRLGDSRRQELRRIR